MRSKRTRGNRAVTVWAVAVAAMIQAGLQALEALMEDSPHRALLWTGGAVALSVLAFVAERYKIPGVE